MPKKYAEGTSVPVSKSKGDIDKLLREWDCDRIMWEEDFRHGFIALRFVWSKDNQAFATRLEVQLPSEGKIRSRPDVLDKRTNKVNENRVRAMLEKNGRAEMRLLLLWLKAAFNAVEAGILDPRVVFLPFFVNENNDTVADIIIPALPQLMSGKAKLLGR